MGKIKAGLARVSTDKQQYAVALSNQIQRLREAGCDRIYADIASRSDENRGGVESLLMAVKAGEIESVTVTVLDRATGSPALFDRLTKILSQHGVPLHGIDEAIDIVSEGGEMVAGIGVVMAKMEVRKIRARSQRGHNSKKKNNRPNANPPFGYIARDRKYVLDARPFLCLIDGQSELSRSDLARDTIEIFRQNKSLTAAILAIHEKYGIWHRSTPRTAKASSSFILEDGDELDGVTKPRESKRSQFSWTHKGLRNWLFNPVLRGHTSYGTRALMGLDDCGRRKFSGTLPQEQWDIRRDTHPESALLTESDYEQFKMIIEINKNARPNTAKWIENQTLRYPVSGLVYCGECGGKCGAQGTKPDGHGGRRIYYKCRNAMKNACSQTKAVRNDRIETAIVAMLSREAIALDAQINVDNPSIQSIASPELVLLREQLKGMMSLGNSSIIAAAIDEIRLQIKRLEFEENNKVSATQKVREDLLEILSAPDYWEVILSNLSSRTEVFNRFVSKVVIHDGCIISIALNL
jgi:DNA invertase Pin-like site-specific DNA recombinase